VTGFLQRYIGTVDNDFAIEARGILTEEFFDDTVIEDAEITISLKS
jgi:hypothetical protein